MKPLPDCEWNFYNIAQKEIFAAHEWEFSRQAMIEKNPTFKNPAGDGWGFNFDGPVYPCPPWPHKAFSLLSKDLRAHLSETIHQEEPRSGISPAFWADFIGDTDDLWPCGDNCIQYGGRTIAAFNIDWSKPNKSLIRGFEEWLKNLKDRPKETPASGRKRIPGELDALGCYRIVKHHGDVSAAMKFGHYKFDWDSSQRRNWDRKNTEARLTLRDYGQQFGG